VLADFLGIEPAESPSLQSLREVPDGMTVVLPIPGTPVSSRTLPAPIQLFFDVLA
jgi:hypothetical protein